MSGAAPSIIPGMSGYQNRNTKQPKLAGQLLNKNPKSMAGFQLTTRGKLFEKKMTPNHLATDTPYYDNSIYLQNNTELSLYVISSRVSHLYKKTLLKNDLNHVP